MTHLHKWAIKTLVAEEVYTDRQYFLDYFYQAALKSATRRTTSTVLLGQRRMGKTEIFKRIVNRLFFEQDHRDPKAVVPVYYCFPDTFKDEWHFATKYVENFIRWYAAFRLRDRNILLEESVNRDALITTLRDQIAMTDGFKSSFQLLNSLIHNRVSLPEKLAIQLPRRVSDDDDSTIVVFLDALENARWPQYHVDLLSYLKEAVESPTCPHFITSSVKKTLQERQGPLFEGFCSEPIEPLTGYYGSELALKAANFYQATLTEEMAPVVAERCGGNPFYITAVIKQAAEQKQALTDEPTLNVMLAIDLSTGFIWSELYDQVNQWLDRINDYDLVKWVLYLSALEDGTEIDINRIQQQLLERDGQQVSIETIREILIKLSRGDLIDYKEFGGWFGKVDDPILLDFLKVWGQIEVESINPTAVKDNLIKEYRRTKRQFAELKGYLAEVYLAQILLNSRRQKLPGHYFHQAVPIEVPNFIHVGLRERLGAAEGMEIDVHGWAGAEQWVAESKWIAGRKVGVKEVNQLIDKAKMVQKERDADIVRAWFFSHDGFTKEAETLMQEQHIFWSTREDLDGLLDYVKLRRLPTL